MIRLPSREKFDDIFSCVDTFDRLVMVSYQCSIYFVLKTHRFQIFDFKYAVTLKTGLGFVKVIENGTIR